LQVAGQTQQLILEILVFRAQLTGSALERFQFGDFGF